MSIELVRDIGADISNALATIEKTKRDIIEQGKTPKAFDQAAHDALPSEDEKLTDLIWYIGELQAQRARKPTRADGPSAGIAREIEGTGPIDAATMLSLRAAYRNIGRTILSNGGKLPPVALTRPKKRKLTPGKDRKK
jgi:hypothetical protein